VEERVKTSVTAAIQAMAYEAGGGCFHRGNASVGGKLRITVEAAARSENAGECPSDDESDTEDLSQRRETCLDR